ncbi:MAG: hypothetical protein U9N62_06850 [Thermotogota bacterium]|nr:hypothetical protein [Thermotogota bacterium]
MFKMPDKIEYALPEKIGNPGLFTGRKEEFDFFFGDWYMNLEGHFPQNQAILSRRKKGKSSFMQRLFNILWSAGAEKKPGELQVIPFYYSIRDSDQSLKHFALDFFTSFVKQYMSYKVRKKEYLRGIYTFEELSEIINDKEIEKIYRSMEIKIKNDDWAGMWSVASETPAVIGQLKGEKIIQIIDEFQYINEYIYDKDGEKLDRLSGTYMYVSEMREAPMIVSGSEVHWLLRIVSSLTGRFQTYPLENLPEDEAKDAIERYATFTRTTIDKQAKEKIWQLTRGDPLYIKALFISRFNRKKDYTVDDNIIQVYEKEIQQGEIYGTWMEYMIKTFHSVNKANSKRIMLYLFQEGEERTRAQIKKDLNLPYTDEELENRLEALVKGDLISHGESHFDYKITTDKTYELFFRNIYQKEIEHFVPDIEKELRQILGKKNYMQGKYTEFLIKEKLKKPFNLKDICENGKDLRIVPQVIEERKVIPTGVGKSEIDVFIKAQKGYKIYIDIKNTKQKYGKKQADRWIKIAEYIRENEKKAVLMVYSEKGYTAGTKEKLLENGIFIII